MKTKRICVVGASNMDLISYVPKLPKIGETLHGSKFAMGFGGKGANQAVMAAKLGGDVAMITKLGDDTFGKDTLKNYEDFGIDTKGITFTADAFSGVAPIAVDPEGNNSIIVVSGANDLLTKKDLLAVEDVITGSKILLCQLEIYPETSLEALKIAKEAGIMTILNPAPARENLPPDLFTHSDIFCPNETETEMITGMPVGSDEEAEAAAREILSRGAKVVILTLGERGCLLVTEDEAELIPATRVTPKDTTGAGDSFVGSLAYFLAEDYDLKDAIGRANSVAAISVQRLGTQTSYPVRDELPADFFSRN